jgi:hypothetical protein
MLMTAKNFSLLASVIFAIVAILHGSRSQRRAYHYRHHIFSTGLGKLDCLYHCLGAGVDRF